MNLDLDSLAPEVVAGIRLVPVVHERVDLAAVVRALLAEVKPAGVAVELPATLREVVDKAVDRLPEISVVVSEEPGEDALLWVVTPGDPAVEALRWAREEGRKSFLVDPDVKYGERHRDPVPDPYALWHLGAAEYLGEMRKQAASWPSSPADAQREAGMAHFLQRARQELDQLGEPGPLMAFLGVAHVERVAQLVGKETASPFARRQRTHLELRNLHPESLSGLMADAPLVHAVHEQLRSIHPQAEEQPSAQLEATLAQTVSRRVPLERAGFRIIAGEKDQQKHRRRRSIPAYAARVAGRQIGSVSAVDRQSLGAVVWQIASRSYLEQTQEKVAVWQRRLFFDFSRRYTLQQGWLVPGLYEWVVAARGVADDNLAWEVFDVARTYPWQRDSAELPTARLDGDELDLGTRKVRFRRRFFRVKQRPLRVPVGERAGDEAPEDWLKGFDSLGICSYPKEDLVIEDYADFLQKKAVSVLSAERRRTEPFSTSLMDGIDVRETLRNLHEGRIYVREERRAPGQAGSVVVIFEDESTGSQYPYLMTWHGEHSQESDMAFYATDPFQQVVGPGITRATYGGFLMTSPPGRLFDVWEDSDYAPVVSKAEVLVRAAVDYSEQRLVVHVAPRPPGAGLKRYAGLQGKRLVHLPLASLSPVTLKKIRVVHLLAGHDKRALAKRYIW